ncbi:MAG: hypothetical protein ACLU38_01145 [Dysosmobacter sp.]
MTPGRPSSNTCGPYRIARLARALLGAAPPHHRPCMARRGGCYDTFYGKYAQSH